MQREKRKITSADLDRMCVPEELRRARYDQVSERIKEPLGRFLKRLSKYMENGTSLLLLGDEGVGKSSIASIVAKQARAHSFTVYWLSCWALRDARRNHRRFDEEQSVMERVMGVDLLVLDGLTEEDARDRYYGWQEIVSLMQVRASKQRATILTTGLGNDTDVPVLLLKDKVSRLIEFPVTGPNLRRKQNDELRRDLFEGGS